MNIKPIRFEARITRGEAKRELIQACGFDSYTAERFLNEPDPLKRIYITDEVTRNKGLESV